MEYKFVENRQPAMVPVSFFMSPKSVSKVRIDTKVYE
jgi:hypothetical protein